MGHEKTFEAINKLKDIEAELHRLKNALEMANKALEAKQEPMMEKLKDAFFEGFVSVETYNDTRLNSVDEAWAKYEANLKEKNT